MTLQRVVHLRRARPAPRPGPRPLPDRRVLDVEAAGVGAWEYDPATGALYCAERTRGLLGADGEGPDGLEDALALVHPDDRAAVRAAVAAALDPAGDGRCRVAFRRAADEPAPWLEARGRAEFADGSRGRRALLLRGALLELDPGAGEQAPEGDGAAVAWGPLTRREQEVAVLVARGLTNRQVGRWLALEEGTAANHVRRILLRLGVRSRAALAAWVAGDARRRAHPPPPACAPIDA